jgi:hypothetical protein
MNYNMEYQKGYEINDYMVVKNKHELLMKELLKQLSYNYVLHRKICEIEIKTENNDNKEGFVTIKSTSKTKNSGFFNFMFSFFKK